MSALCQKLTFELWQRTGLKDRRLATSALGREIVRITERRPLICGH